MPYVDANQKRFFFYRKNAVGTSKPRKLHVFAIHGLGSSHAFYLPIFPQLADAGLTCFSYDTYGSARSGISDQGGAEQSVETMAQDALAVMAGLDLTPEHTILIGHSMGGMVACQLASGHRFAGLVLLGPVHPTPAAAEIFAKRIKVVQEAGMEAMADTIPGAATGQNSTPTQQALIRTLLLSQEPEGYVSLCKVIANAAPPEYRDVKSPILLLAGEEDKSAPMGGCLTILESCGTSAPEKKLEVLRGVGHWHCIEAPEDVGNLVVQFAAGL